MIDLIGEYAHMGSAENLLGKYDDETAKELSPRFIARKGTPPAFIWNTLDDGCVNVNNTLNYVKKLKDIETDVECHIFAHGAHGLGLALGSDKISKNVTQWCALLLNWLGSIEF